MIKVALFVVLAPGIPPFVKWMLTGMGAWLVELFLLPLTEAIRADYRAREEADLERRALLEEDDPGVDVDDPELS